MTVDAATRLARVRARNRRVRGWIEPALDAGPLLEAVDALERRGGGKWRQAEVLLPGEQVIEDERLTTPRGGRMHEGGDS